MSMLPRFNERFDSYIAPARRFPQLWRLVLGVFLISAVYIGFIALMIGIGWLVRGRDGIAYLLSGFSGQASPQQTLLLMLTFAGFALGAFLAARVLNKRMPGTLFGPARREVWKNFRFAFLLIAGLYTVPLAITSFLYPPVANVSFSSWILWLPLALVLLFLQTTSEEVVFRGYLQQQLAARFSSPIMWWVLPSLVFSMLHYQPAAMGPNTWLVIGHTFLFGLIAADVTARTGNLGAAMGLHFANNIYALLLVSVDGTLTGLSLFVTPFSGSDTVVLRGLLLADFAIILIGYGIYVRLMARRGF